MLPRARHAQSSNPFFCALANDDTAVVKLSSFAPPSVGQVQTPFL